MLPFSSSISSSKPGRPKRGDGRLSLRSSVAGALIWTLGALIFIDAAVGFACRMPADARKDPSSFQQYFDYGTSIEGKLRRMVGRTPEEDAPIVRAGWLIPDCTVNKHTAESPAFDIYGMSFTQKIAEQMQSIDPAMIPRRFDGPSAPLNHSYACFITGIEAGRELAPIQILGILASTVRRMETISGLTTSFEGPMPFTYPRYYTGSDGTLTSRTASIASPNDLRRALRDPSQWQSFVDELSNADYFYSPFLFRADIFDHSVILRMIRRAYGQHMIRARTDALRPKEGFAGSPDIAKVLNAIFLSFSQKCRDRGVTPMVILIEDGGYGRTLSPIAIPMLRAAQIDYVSTASIAPPDDSANFVADGHFTRAAFRRIAAAVLEKITAKSDNK